MSGRDFRGKPCPKCGRKGLNYAPHPHAFGWKDYGHVKCQYCGGSFKLKPRPMRDATPRPQGGESDADA